MMRIYKLLPLTILSHVFSFILLISSSQAFANYTLPSYEKLTLENGLTVYLMEQHEVPLIDINVVIKAGAVADSKQGLAYLTAQNLMLGTKKKTKTELNETVDFIGANVYSTAGVESSFIVSSFAKKDQQQMLTLVRDMVINPRFDTKEFDKKKKQHLLALEQEKESPKSVINNYYKQLVFGQSQYSTVVDGTIDSIKKIQLADINAFHKHWYQPKNAALVIVGDFNAKTMLKQIKALFSSWKNHSTIKAITINKPAPLTQAKVLLVNKSDAIESTFAIGGLGVTKNNPDRVGISVINTILGGRFTSWLNDELRVNSGLTYGARSRFAQYSQAGSFTISSFTKTETTIEAIDLALKTYSRLWEQGINEKTLASAKAYVKGKFPPNFETSADLSGLLAQMYAYNFDESYINTFEQQVNSLTVEKTKNLIQQYFPKKHLQMVIIGKASVLKDQVKKYGLVEQVEIK